MTDTSNTNAMSATVNLPELRKAMGPAVKIARGYITGVRLEAAGSSLTITATDLDTAYTVTVAAVVDAPGLVVVGAKDLTATLKGKGSATLVAGPDSLTVTNGTATTLRTMDPAEFPKTPDVTGEVRGLDLRTVAEIAAAASTDDCRPILAGVFLNGNEIVATDSYRLHLHRGAIDYPQCNIPARALLMAAKMADHATITFAPRQGTLAHYVRVNVGAATFTVRTIDGEFPNYAQLIPTSHPHALTVDRDAFTAIVAATVPLSKVIVGKYATAAPVRLTVADGTLTAAITVADHGATSGTVPAKGDDLELFPPVAFNPQYLLSAVTTLRDERVTITLLDNLKPAMITEARADGITTRLLMPVRIS